MCSLWDSAVRADCLHWTDVLFAWPATRLPSGRTVRNRRLPVNEAWILLGMAVAAGGVVLATTWLRRGERVDLGSVSHQWIAEQRTGQGYDSQR